MPKRVHWQARRPGWRGPEGCRSVGRGTAFGNPSTPSKLGDPAKGRPAPPDRMP
jgi:hypothetical protein